MIWDIFSFLEITVLLIAYLNIYFCLALKPSKSLHFFKI